MATRRSVRLSSALDNLVEKASLKELPAQNNKRKAVSSPSKDADGFTVPITPKRKRTLATEPPATPTPVAAKAMAVPYKSGNKTQSTPSPPRRRLADPRFTNAPLISPQTSRIVASLEVEGVSPQKNGRGTTTESILDAALKHLMKVDPRLKPVIEKHTCQVFSPEGLAETIDPFHSLASGIISQQVCLTQRSRTNITQVT